VTERREGNMNLKHWCLLGLCLLVNCRPASTSSNQVEAGATDTPAFPPQAVCANLIGVDSTGTLTAICATVEEIAIIATFIADLRARVGDAGAPRVCTPLPGTRLCATDPELSAGIGLVLNRRKSVVTRDGGI
jgi:hypothetical protein